MLTSTTKKKQVTLATGTDAVATGIYVQNATDLKIIRRRDATDTTLVNVTDYTITDIRVAGGCTVTFVGQDAGDDVTIKRITPLTQTGDYPSNSAFPPETNEDGHDKSRMIDQDQDEVIQRSIQFPESEEETADGQYLPSRDARKNKILGFDSAGDFSVSSVDDLVTDVGYGARVYSMTAGSSVSPAITITTVEDTSTWIELHGVVDALGSHRIRRYLITDMASEATTIVSNIDNILAGKTGAEDVDFTVGAIGKITNVTLDGTALTTTQDVTIKIYVKTVKSISDLTFVFLP